MAEGNSFFIGRLQIGWWKTMCVYTVEKQRDYFLIGIGHLFICWWKI